MKDDLTVGGYIFGSLEDASAARKEKEKIDYLEGKLNYNNPRNILLVYHKAIDSKLFITPIGYEFLIKIQKYLKNSNIPESEIKKIPLYKIYSDNADGKTDGIRTRIVKVKQPAEPRKFTFKLSIFLNFIFALVILVMFVLAFDSDSPNIINYRTAILNQYASWEQELSEREEQIREAEKELGITNPNP